MKRILFVNPGYEDTIFGQMRILFLPPMGLAALASRTPDSYEVSIVDENVEDLDSRAEADLVAVTATTVQAPRAYKILQRFKRRGIPTVMGGIHASVMTDEASRHADAVVVGEADEVWGGLLADFNRGDLQQVYRADAFPSLKGLPHVDRSLLSRRYFVDTVQTSRGCPCNCNFCSVTQFNGKRYRFRPTNEVLEEIAGLGDRLFISDDSIVGLGAEGIEHARRLFRGMKGLGKSWGAQVCITIAEHDDLLSDAAEAGANTFYIGFESVEAASLKSMSKGINLRPAIRNYKEAIDRMHDHGIGVIGGFILGSDGDTKEIFDRTIEFIHESGIDGSQFTIMTPFPGTRFYEQMRKEGRLLHTNYPDDWARYNAYEAVIEPRNMTVEELLQGQRRVYNATSSLSTSLLRSAKTLLNTRSPVNAVTNFLFNFNNYQATKGLAQRTAARGL